MRIEQIQTGDTYRTQLPLVESQLGNQKVYKLDAQKFIDNTDHDFSVPPDKDMILVKFDKGAKKWTPVNEIKKNIQENKLVGEYGLWKDKEVSEGLIFKKVLRPKDNIVQRDEVIPFKEILNQEYFLRGFVLPLDDTLNTKITDAHISLHNGPKGTIAMLEANHKVINNPAADDPLED